MVPTPRDALALAADLERAGQLATSTRLGSENDSDAGLGWIRAVDRARARAGHDAIVGAQVVRGDSMIGATPCGALLAPGVDHLDLDAWLASCPSPPGGPYERVVEPGLPALAAWLPELGLLALHPALNARLEADADVTLATVQAPLVAGDAGCVVALEAWCARCPLGNEDDCEPLFGPDTEPVGCAALDTASPSPWPDAPQLWRERYCAWRGTSEQPWMRFSLLSGAYFGSGGQCWDPAVRVVDLASLLLAFPWQGECAAAVRNANFAIDQGTELTLEAPLNKQKTPWSPWQLRLCARYMDEVSCVACTPDPRGECVGMFGDSSAAGDCFALRRAEAGGGGFAAYCAREYAIGFLGRACANLYEHCYDERFLGPDLASFEQLVGLFPGFFDPRLREACIDQYQACLDGSPYHDLDLTRPIPTAVIDVPSSGSESDSKCPQ